MVFDRNNEQLGEGRRQEADKVEVRFRGSKGDQGRKGTVVVRTSKACGVGEDGGAVGLLVELISMYCSGELTGEALLMAYRAAEGRTVWSREQATQCLRSGTVDVGGEWSCLLYTSPSPRD